MNKLLLIFAFALLACLLPMPYGYFMLIRFAAMIIFGLMALIYYQEQKEGMAIFFGSMVILFQPIIKISLGRTMWNIVDVVMAIVLLAIWYRNSQKK